MNVKENFALLYGVMLGDGCLSIYKTKEGRERFVICITGDYYTDKEFYNNVLSPLLKSLGRRSVTVKERPKNGTLEINFPDKELLEKIRNLGFPIGKKGNSLSIPKIFFDNDLVGFVIKGFFSTDGSLVLTKNPNKFYPRLETHGISRKLINQADKYLISIGLKSKFYKCKRNKKDFRWKTAQPQYRFQINGHENLLCFEKLIGFLNPKHESKFRDFLKYSREYDGAIKRFPTQKQRPVRNKINKKFIERMATPRVELGTSCS